MNFPDNFKYSKDHTWLLLEGETGKIGISDFAQSELGDMVYIDLPRVGQSFKKNDEFGSAEAVKTTSDLFMPVSGTISKTNLKLKDEPTLVNTDPFGEGWMIEIKLTNISEVDTLQSAEEHKKETGN